MGTGGGFDSCCEVFDDRRSVSGRRVSFDSFDAFDTAVAELESDKLDLDDTAVLEEDNVGLGFGLTW